MSRLDELIKEKCPNGVERKMLADLEDAGVITLGRGKVISKKDIQDNPGEYPIYSSSAVGSGLLGTYGDYMFEDVRLSWSIDGGGKFFYRDAPKYSVTNVCGWLTVNKPEVLDIKYLYFALSNEWSKKDFDYVHKAHPSVIRKEYIIPVPPLEIQKEIVGMLNSFTELEAELEAELTKRKQQYEHYRDHLLSFKNIAGEGGQVEWITLKDLCKVNRGKRVVRDQLSENETDGFPVYQNSLKPLGYFNEYNCEAEKAFVICAGAAGEVGFSKVNFWAADDCSYFTCDNRISERYLYHILMNNGKYLSSKVRRSSIPRLSKEFIENIKVPVPNKKIQERIIYVLDNFDAVCNDLNIGLPAEVEARQKQYEYYRDRLLSFDAVVGGDIERERSS